MQEVDINMLVDKNKILNKNIPNDIIIVGKINSLFIRYKYKNLNLFKIDCNEIHYHNQERLSIKNHILSNSLRRLFCSITEIISLPDLPNSLQELYCSNNQLTSLPNLPNSLKELYCSRNQLTSLPNLPNSLEKLSCSGNRITSLPNLPNSLIELSCSGNQLLSMPDFSHINHKLILNLYQNSLISYIPYNTNIKLNNLYINKINIIEYPHNPITNQDQLNKYMDYIKNYQLNRIKSARN